MDNAHARTIAAALARLEMLDALADVRGLAPAEQAERDTLAILAPVLRDALNSFRPTASVVDALNSGDALTGHKDVA